MRNLLLIILLILGLMTITSCTLVLQVGGTYYKDGAQRGGIEIIIPENNDVPETERE